MNKKNKDSLYLPQLTHLLGIEKLSPQDINFIIKNRKSGLKRTKINHRKPIFSGENTNKSIF